ncbi:MAG: F0F1 ATP synthase subunit epsilon [Bacteroidales bacterium]|jgi:F-type H+-transporting ATPase subunit epsilon|nr:F0F1 ATP synthase subunit epsilon [Bacteroidales bacterium]
MMTINIITPDKTLYEGEVKQAKLVGIDGSFEILQNHAPLISVLAKGKIELIDGNNKPVAFDINSGLIEVANNKIQILAR